MKNMKKYAPLVLRVGISLVVLWFGFQQLLHPQMWVRILPAWTASLPFTPLTLIAINSWFEIIFGLALLVGFQTRIVAFLVALHIFHIAYTLGYGAVGVRDFGLGMAALSMAMGEPNELSLDGYLAKKRQMVV
ncbi:MAG: DoxX family protein [Candidatus Pacebacteria bacterium]|nr:DoxX family protein [Candidatus Paceibacterota bacterium]